MRQNLRYVIGAITIVVVGLIVYLYSSHSNAQRIAACQRLGEERRELELKEAKDKSEVLSPIYTWSRRYDTCIYSGGTLKVDFKEKLIGGSRYIKDLYTNKDIVFYFEAFEFGESESASKTFTAGNQEELDVLRQELK